LHILAETFCRPIYLLKTTEFYSGVSLCLYEFFRRSRVRIPSGRQVFRSLCIAVLLSKFM
jgi:hypothetical protein